MNEARCKGCGLTGGMHSPKCWFKLSEHIVNELLKEQEVYSEVDQFKEWDAKGKTPYSLLEEFKSKLNEQDMILLRMIFRYVSWRNQTGKSK